MKLAPQLSTGAIRAKPVLNSYANMSNAGKITLELIDPKPFSDQVNIKVAGGWVLVPLEDLVRMIQASFGLAATQTSTTGQKNINVFRRYSLEYDITRLIAELAQTKTNNKYYRQP